MNVFESTTNLYNAATHLNLEHVIFSHEGIRDFEETVRLLQQADGFEDDETVTQLSLMRYWYSNCPLPTNSQMYREHVLTSRLLQDLELGRVQELQLPDSLSKGLALLECLWKQGVSPILDEVYEIAEANSGASICLLVRQRNWCAAVQEQVVQDGHLNITVVAPTDLAKPTTYDVMVVVGNHHRFADHVFTAPRANRIVVVSLAWHGNFREIGPSFFDSQIEPITPTVHIKSDPGAIPDQSLTETSEPSASYLEARLQSHYASPEGEGLSSVPTVLARLYEDFSVFLDASGDKANLIIDPELDGELLKLDHKGIKPGMFIVLRSDTGDDHIEEAADILLGSHAPQFRNSLRIWKARLRIKTNEMGPYRASKELQSMGLNHASENNIRNWCSNRSIATRRKSDFAILMAFLGLETETDSLWTAAKAVRDAHLTAGMRISKQLKLLIKEYDNETLGQQGRIDFAHPTLGGARLSAFQIESISPIVTQVSENNLLRLLDPSEG